MERYLAIDPGVSGGLVWGNQDGAIQAVKMPATEGGVVDLLRSTLASDGVTTAVVEDIPKYIGHAIPSSSAAVLFRNFGFLLGALHAMGARTVLVTPQTWQKPLGLGTVAGAGGKPMWKRKLMGEAQRRFPNLHLTLSTADAALIYDYALRTNL